jgi:hypothetical protein
MLTRSHRQTGRFNRIALVIFHRQQELCKPRNFVPADVARHTQTVVVAVRALAPDLVELKMQPPLNANARFGWVSLKSRTESPLARLLFQAALNSVAHG